jgi:CheY-like chemotaxis protein
MQQYTAFVLDDNVEVRELIVDCLKGFANFDACGYGQAEKVLSALFDPPQQAPPDLLVVDLNLEPGKIQGIQLLTELVERDIPSEILVISGAGGDDLEKALRMGIVAVIRKPFDSVVQVVKKMELMAEIGRKRRLYRLEGRNRGMALDAVRFVRPVFLSYAKEDKSLAMGIRRNLEAREIPVWYAPSALEVGDAWRLRIDEAIRQATVFVAIISDRYAASQHCLEELTQFRHRIIAGSKPPLVILPVTAGASEPSKKHDLIRPVLDEYHYIDMSAYSVDGLTALLGRIQRLLGQQLYGDFVSRAASIGS